MEKSTKNPMHEGQNKIARFICLDQLLRSPEGVTLQEIINDPKMDCISKRLLQQKLKEFEEKYGAEFEQQLYRGRERLWRYKNPEFSILKQTSDNVDIIRQSIEKLSLFKGDPRYDLLRFYLIGLSKGLSEEGLNYMSFDNSSEVVGLEHVDMILDAITNRYPLKMKYKSFGAKEFVCNIHPYHLRQYNKRWYLFAYSEDKQEIFNFPLDRMISLEHLSKAYIPTDVNFDDYFDDIVGVSNYKNREVEKILIKVNRKSIDYIRTKPLHGSQTELKELETESHVYISLKVKVNTELKMLLFSYNDAIEVIEPLWFRNEFAESVKKMRDIYEG